MSNIKHIIALLTQTSVAHHHVKHSVYGDETEWSRWYAQYLLKKTDFKAHSINTYTEKSLAAELSILHDVYTNGEYDESWQEYYARQL